MASLLFWGMIGQGLPKAGYARLPATTALPSLRVMTWNAYFLNKNTAAFFATVATEKPDLIAIQELGMPLAEAISTELSETFPYQALYPSKRPDGMAILSRYPLLTTTAPDFRASGGCNCQIVTFDFDGKPVTLINTHPWPPKTALTGGRAFEFNTENQDRIFDQLLARIEQAASPLLVVGDLNTMPIQTNYRRISRMLTDAYVANGIGPANTFPVRRNANGWLSQPLIRIDYIFYDQAWQAQQTWVGTSAGSDHRYVIADLVLNR